MKKHDVETEFFGEKRESIHKLQKKDGAWPAFSTVVRVNWPVIGQLLAQILPKNCVDHLTSFFLFSKKRLQ
jgi:hypothetical protein